MDMDMEHGHGHGTWTWVMCVMAGGAAACGVCHVACIIKISVIENSVNCRHISVGAKGVCACGAEVVRLSPSRDPCRRPPPRRVALRTCSARRAALR
jgi:hypothetical protein